MQDAELCHSPEVKKNYKNTALHFNNYEAVTRIQMLQSITQKIFVFTILTNWKLSSYCLYAIKKVKPNLR